MSRTPSYEFELLHQFEEVFRDGEHRTQAATRDYSRVWENVINNPPDDGVTPVLVYRQNGEVCAAVAGIDELVENDVCAMEIARLAAEIARLKAEVEGLRARIELERANAGRLGGFRLLPLRRTDAAECSTLERAARMVHEIWAGWYRWQRDHSTEENVARWERQEKTDYSDLSENEKESDRTIARRYLSLFAAEHERRSEEEGQG